MRKELTNDLEFFWIFELSVTFHLLCMMLHKKDVVSILRNIMKSVLTFQNVVRPEI